MTTFRPILISVIYGLRHLFSQLVNDVLRPKINIADVLHEMGKLKGVILTLA